jgi:hypothetical protein
VKTLLVIALAAVAAYFVYQSVTEEAATCSGAHNACLKSCRRTSTEAPAAQACQQACQREADACNARR